MKKAKRWRYYCDFCKKTGGSAFHLKNHESACTNNPDRVCKMCNLMDLSQQPIKTLLDIVKSHKVRVESFDVYDDDFFNEIDRAGIDLLEKLKEATDGCPACILAALRQGEADELSADFDWKKERDSFMSDVNIYRQTDGSY